MIEVYAVVDDPGPPLPEPGSLISVARNGLALVCAPAGDLGLTPEELWAHEHVVEELMRDRDLLPARYGTRLDDEGAAARALDERHDELAAALEGVRGAVELSLRVLGQGEQVAPPDDSLSGVDYMRAKAGCAAAREGAVQAVHGPLSQLARAATQRRPGPGPELLRAAYLVERGAITTFTERVSQLQGAHPDLRLLCTGPWPPYSFSQA